MDSNYNVSIRPAKTNEILVKGDYYVVDPCYIFGNDDNLWKEICSELQKCDEILREEGKNCDSYVMNIYVKDKDYSVFIFGTAHGDGCYPVYKSGKYIGECGVDAGLLSFIKKDITNFFKYEDRLGTEVEIKEDSLINNKNSDVFVGNIAIYTNNIPDETIEDDDDDDDEEDDEDDEDDISYY
jgi:hypothetical protein